MKKAKILFIALAIFIVLPVLAIGGFLATFDANAYRAQISEALTKQLGRTVDLGGPIKLHVSWGDGLSLAVSDVKIGNPPWAKRKDLAKVGALSLGVGLQPLLDHKLEIRSFTLSDADIQMETNASGQTNWNFQPAGAAKTPESSAKKVAAGPAEKGAASPVAVAVRNVQIRHGHIVIVGKDGAKQDFVVDSLTLQPQGQGIDVAFSGSVDGKAVKLTLTGDALDRLMKANWPFKADLAYANYNLHAEGALSGDGKNVKLDRYDVTAGGTKLTGALALTLGGARPFVQGTLTSDRLDPADLKPQGAPTAAEAPSSGAGPAAAPGGTRIFSASPLNLDGLRSVDAKLDISIGELPVGDSAIKQIHAKVNLSSGRLAVTPLSLILAGAQAEGRVELDASAVPAHIDVQFKAPQLDLSQLAALGSKLGGYVTGKGDFDVTVTTSGNSLHDFASNANGRMDFISDGGKISTQILGGTAGTVLGALSPQTSSGMTPLNCLAARFKIINGVMQTDGVLADTAPVTVAGGGGVSLRDEVIDMVVHTKPKAGSIKGVNVGSIAPSVKIRGPLAKPSFMPDAAAGVQNVVGMLLGGSVKSAPSSVPDIVTQPGQNACVYTLDHPQAAPTPSASAPATPPASLKDAGKQLLQGLGGLFGGQK